MLAGKNPEFRRTIIRKLDSAPALDLDDPLWREGVERFKHRLSETLQENFLATAGHESSSGGNQPSDSINPASPAALPGSIPPPTSD